MDNTFLRVIINDQSYDYPVNWLTNSGWRYISVTFQKIYLDNISFAYPIGITQIQIYLDAGLVATATLNSYFIDIDTSSFSDMIGQNFYGIISRFRIKSQAYCNLATTPSVSTSKLKSS